MRRRRDPARAREVRQRAACGRGVRAPTPVIRGAGLGRLAWEAAVAGYDAQGNEFSYYMMLASNFVLNSTSDLLQSTILDAAAHTGLAAWTSIQHAIAARFAARR